MPSKKANRYGTLAERHFADERGLTREGVHTPWCDARFQNGVPVEIKSAKHSPGYFQIYKKYHRKLRREGGWYGFVVYRIRGTGIQVLDTKMVRPDRLPISTWGPTGGHRDSDKAYLPVGDVF